MHAGFACACAYLYNRAHKGPLEALECCCAQTCCILSVYPDSAYLQEMYPCPYC